MGETLDQTHLQRMYKNVQQADEKNAQYYQPSVKGKSKPQ